MIDTERERVEFVYRMADIARHPPAIGSFLPLRAIVKEIQEAARREERKRFAEIVARLRATVTGASHDCTAYRTACTDISEALSVLDEEKP